MDGQLIISSATLAAVIAWIAKEFWSHRKEREKQLMIDIREHTKAMVQLSHTMIEFEVELKHIKRAVETLPKIQSDLNVLHEWRRNQAPPRHT